MLKYVFLPKIAVLGIVYVWRGSTLVAGPQAEFSLGIPLYISIFKHALIYSPNLVKSYMKKIDFSDFKGFISFLSQVSIHESENHITQGAGI